MSGGGLDETAAGSPEADSGDARGPDARIGAVVDKYTIVRLLGKGGMGAVYEARHAKLSRRFAIKFLLPELADNREMLRRFENEAKAAGGLEHLNLAAVTDFGRASDGAPYLVMEFLQGEDCSKLLRRLGTLPVPRAADIVRQACRGLAVAHNVGIFHRDLKPENLFLADAGDGRDLVKVLDFGIAKLRSADGSLATSTGATFGTAHYMSPEQARGASEVDQRADVWSLGVVLYEFLSGCKPFNGEQFLHVIHQILTGDPVPLATLRPDLPPRLGAVVDGAMAKDIATRIPTVAALAEALRPFAGRESAVTPPAVAPRVPTRLIPVAQSAKQVNSGDSGPVTPRARRSLAKPLIGAAVVACAFVAAVGFGRLLSKRRTTHPETPVTEPAQRTSLAPFAPAKAELVPSPSRVNEALRAALSGGVPDVKSPSGLSGQAHENNANPQPSTPVQGKTLVTGPSRARVKQPKSAAVPEPSVVPAKKEKVRKHSWIPEPNPY